ncbi:ABC transporter ATP-binding protein [Arthrobacter sp. UM1]|uniref:ABC transporter ATP-binding protein n=1 Tax=Arthrobacter sp. UM1 TaxID=2766776 RepID=UPI001CF68598|nr:ABC transporter ATP-binding protein [Arthrobacter sp. UM1]MCB4208881.1 ABC transporter ATP-binding protein [Arthrobacter sp. UM1]
MTRRARTPVIRLRGVEKRYPPATAALHGVDLDVFAGESLAIVGPSGSGKSTLLAVLGLLERPDAGERVVGGVDASTAKEAELTRLRREHLAFVFQAFHLVDHLTALENVEHALAVRGSGAGAGNGEARDRPAQRRTDAAAEALRSVGLGHRLHAFPPTLSGGERQRVAIARALAGRPEVLLCDEPTGNLDTATAEAVLELLLGQAAEGLAVVVVTHSPELAARCDRTVRVVDGRLEEAGRDAAA